MLFGTLTSSLLVYGILHAGVVSAQEKKNFIVNIKPSGAGRKRGLVRRQEVQAAAAINPDSVLYNYDKVVEGFAARLTTDEVKRLNDLPEVVSVLEDRIYKLDTTRSPTFLGIDDQNEVLGARSFDYSGMHSKREVNAAEANLIIGVLDSGVWPENPSYDDTGMPPIPSHWKGSCVAGEQWTMANCNKKLIGASYFYNAFAAIWEDRNNQTFSFAAAGDIGSARDTDGHGTHTSTTAAGSRRANVSLFGQALGTAHGMAPDARIAIYKVCWGETRCSGIDLLAGMDRAIADGVNVITASLGGQPYFGGEDAFAPGGFAALEKGILVTLSGGNSGPSPATIANNNPWNFNIGASTIDRAFPAVISLGDKRNFTGTSLYANGQVPDVKPLLSTEIVSLIRGADAGSNKTAAALCIKNSLDPALVAGKIVVCTRGENGRVEKGVIVKAAGGRAMILANDAANGNSINSDPHVLPAAHVNEKDGQLILEYAASANATASMDFLGTKLGAPAPLMAAFSSRGPNSVIPQIMKPDVTAPGVDILAGWTRVVGPAGANDTRRTDYNIISGTSMSCPHVAGTVAYILARRPGWSPAAIRSALMTTAYTTTKGTTSPMLDSSSLNAATPFDYGNGHIDPVAALNPGLIYDITPKEYQEFICSVNNTEAFMIEVTRREFPCEANKTYSAYNLNYPSFGAYYNSSVTKGSYTARFPRTVTNVGGAGVYTASLTVADSSLVTVSVNPERLSFKNVGEKRKFELVVRMKAPHGNVTDNFLTSHGRLEWSDGKNKVRSSIGFIWG